ncbi:hypothetical protein PFFCH_03235 [Plasmodium falciparum FCH/4]|uniref:Uncharacterized protein n=1 Tax=Plasmodium falciparum FCH/4 TaxID=1036724 RepID=A0A024VLI7_PLAFA|nr:hypothetical protein PFFCH_03235 [Plasmodium falciparum FCH/4]
MKKESNEEKKKETQKNVFYNFNNVIVDQNYDVNKRNLNFVNSKANGGDMGCLKTNSNIFNKSNKMKKKKKIIIILILIIIMIIIMIMIIIVIVIVILIIITIK